MFSPGEFDDVPSLVPEHLAVSLENVYADYERPPASPPVYPMVATATRAGLDEVLNPLSCLLCSGVFQTGERMNYKTWYHSCDDDDVVALRQKYSAAEIDTCVSRFFGCPAPNDAKIDITINVGFTYEIQLYPLCNRCFQMEELSDKAEHRFRILLANARYHSMKKMALIADDQLLKH